MPRTCGIAGLTVPEIQNCSLDWPIVALAGRQHGVVSLAQFLELGLTESGVRKRARAGRLHRVHRGVYAVGHPTLTREGRWMAAVLAAHETAALAQRTAAENRDLLPVADGIIHIVAPGQAGRALTGVRAHSAATLRPEDVTAPKGIATTTIARTIFDLADSGQRRAAERAIDRADEVHRHDFTDLRALIRRHRGRRGAHVVGAILNSETPLQRTRSELEEAALALLREGGVEHPRTNLWIPFPEGGGAEADLAWPSRKAIIEIDSLTFHRTSARMRHDYLRDQRLELLGWRLRRVAGHQILHTPAHVLDVARNLLG